MSDRQAENEQRVTPLELFSWRLLSHGIDIGGLGTRAASVSCPEGPLVPLLIHHPSPGATTSPKRRGRDSYSG
jgi:hypothetical protein